MGIDQEITLEVTHAQFEAISQDERLRCISLTGLSTVSFGTVRDVIKEHTGKDVSPLTIVHLEIKP